MSDLEMAKAKIQESIQFLNQAINSFNKVPEKYKDGKVSQYISLKYWGRYRDLQFNIDELYDFERRLENEDIKMQKKAELSKSGD